MAKKQAAWTVMVYLAGDNNLTTECMFALTEMKKATLGKQINVIAQFDPSDPYLPTHRYEISGSRKSKSLCYDIIDCATHDVDAEEVCFGEESADAKTLSEVRKLGRKFRNVALDEARLIDSAQYDEVSTDDTDTGSPVTLYNFISFCLEKYPADHYMVILSGHAGGTERDYLLRDESSARSLTLNELRQVFKRVQENRKGDLIDIIGMDNCLMSMAEICYELRGLAQTVVGCESFSPASGWPYRQILKRLSKDFASARALKRKSLVEEAAAAIVEEYVNYYSNYWLAGLSVTQSALKLSKVEELQQEIDRLAVLMERELVAAHSDAKPRKRSGKGNFQDSLLLAHWEAQSYNGEQFVDLHDFCECLRNRVGPGAVASQCRELEKFITSEFVLKSCYCGADYQYSYGVSIYFPWAQVAPSYWNLDFVKDSKHKGWGNFLKTYTLLTRRGPRGVVAGTKLAAGLSEAVQARLNSIDSNTERMTMDRMTMDRMTMDRMGMDRMGMDRADWGRMSVERMNSGLARNRVHSMRNPPNVFFPDECMREPHAALATQETLRLR
jgi:hypothetical protein